MAHALPVPARTVAEHILWMRGDQPTDNAQLSKLVYLCHGWMLGFRGQPLITDPVVVAQTGPIVTGLEGVEAREHELDRGQVEIITMILDGYGSLSGGQLSDLTHEEGTPWHTRQHRLGETIPHGEVQEHYREIIDRMETEMNRHTR